MRTTKYIHHLEPWSGHWPMGEACDYMPSDKTLTQGELDCLLMSQQDDRHYLTGRLLLTAGRWMCLAMDMDALIPES